MNQQPKKYMFTLGMDTPPICSICLLPFNPAGANYGWHYGPRGEAQRCSFPVLPLKIQTGLIDPNPPNPMKNGKTMAQYFDTLMKDNGPC